MRLCNYTTQPSSTEVALRKVGRGRGPNNNKKTLVALKHRVKGIKKRTKYSGGRWKRGHSIVRLPEPDLKIFWQHWFKLQLYFCLYVNFRDFDISRFLDRCFKLIPRFSDSKTFVQKELRWKYYFANVFISGTTKSKSKCYFI